MAADPNDLEKRIRATVYTEEVATVALYESAGFVPERYFVELSKDLGDLDEVTSALPDGVGLIAWTKDRDDEVRIAHNDAFRDHWGSEPLTQERWQRWISGHRAFLPDASFIALAEDQVIGYAVNFAYPEEWTELGYSEGWIGGLGTARPWA